MMEKVCFYIWKTAGREFEMFLYEREHAEATIRKYMTDLNCFFAFLGQRWKVDKPKLLAYKEWLLEHYAVNSVNSMLAALNQFLTFCGHSELKVRRIKMQKNLFLQEEKELTQQEYKRLVQTAKTEGKQQLALCMEAIAVTGIRVSELKYFTVEQVKKGRIEVHNKGKYRRIFLTGNIRKKLLIYAAARKIGSGCIFITRNGKPKDRSNLWSEMKALKKRAGVSGEKIFPHNLRHLFARVYYQTTKDLTGLADVLGHSSLNVTRIYTSNTGELYQRQLDRMTALRI
nr:tyrosine-type recombinase/integrase [uncultured Sellimonas sp.]